MIVATHCNRSLPVAVTAASIIKVSLLVQQAKLAMEPADTIDIDTAIVLLMMS